MASRYRDEVALLAKDVGEHHVKAGRAGKYAISV
jgi:hypothetical protein